MDKTFDLYRDIAERTDGDVYIGVVGPVRTAMSLYRSNVLSMQKPPCVALAKRYARLRARNAKKA